LATLAIYIRCIYRIIELQAGLDSHLAQYEVKFMILEGAIIAISVSFTVSCWKYERSVNELLDYYDSQWDVSPLYIHRAVYFKLAAPSYLLLGGWKPTL